MAALLDCRWQGGLRMGGPLRGLAEPSWIQTWTAEPVPAPEPYSTANSRLRAGRLTISE